MRAALNEGSWYLVGSRAAGFGDGFSDWDTMLLLAKDPSDKDSLAGLSDEIFGTQRPPVAGPPTLDLHHRWRAANAVDINVLSPGACRGREIDNLAEWAFDLRHAIPLALAGDTGERYRDRVAERFRRSRSRLATSSYLAFRKSRNEAVATLPRQDQAAQTLTASCCVAHAARFWLLAAGEPHPADKWLLAALRRCADAETVGVMAVALDIRRTPSDRFDALFQLWEAVDEQAVRHGIERAHLQGSPFV
jgi:hypothetical protein